MKVALVHDYLVQYGGGERVLEVLSDMFPEAPIYTLMYDAESMYGAFEGKDIRTSFIQNIPWAKQRHRMFPWLMPLGIEDLDLSEYDVVISSSSSYAKGIITDADTIHISYCHTPMRYAWDDCHRYFSEFQYSSPVKAILPFAMNYIRMWDKVSADRVDYYIANSQNVARRIQKYYHLDSDVIYPPVFVDSFPTEYVSDEPYYLIVGRFLAYKHYDIVIEAFRDNGKTLKIVGAGPEEDHLKQLAQGHSNIEFLGRLSDPEARDLFAGCQAVIFPSEDDFGIVPVEAMAAGKPVIGYGQGGALETIIDGVTGLFFEEQSAQSVQDAVLRFETLTFDSDRIKSHAQVFSRERFQTELSRFVTTKYNHYHHE